MVGVGGAVALDVDAEDVGNRCYMVREGTRSELLALVIDAAASP